MGKGAEGYGDGIALLEDSSEVTDTDAKPEASNVAKAVSELSALSSRLDEIMAELREVLGKFILKSVEKGV